MQALGFVSRGLWRSFARPRLQGARWEEPCLLGLSLDRLYCGCPHALPTPSPCQKQKEHLFLLQQPSSALSWGIHLHAHLEMLKQILSYSHRAFIEGCIWSWETKKMISDTISVKLKCYAFVSCYSFWDFPWIVLPSSGLWCLQMTFGQLSASPHCLGMKLHVLVSSWNVFNQQLPNVLHGLLGSPRPSQGLFSN